MIGKYLAPCLLALWGMQASAAERVLVPGATFAMGSANVILYAIGLGKNLDKRLDFYGRLSLEEVLSTLARDTGGRAFSIPAVIFR